MRVVWTMLDCTPPGEFTDTSDPWYLAGAIIGVFSSKDAALQYLRDFEVGRNIFDRFTWEQSPDNPDHIYGWSEVDPERYVLDKTTVDEPVAKSVIVALRQSH